MAARKRAGRTTKQGTKQSTKQSTKRASSSDKSAAGFTAEERAAMRDHVRELRAERGGKEVNDESSVLAKIASMEGSDRTMAERIHALVRATVPTLVPRLWYGMPAYARDGNVVCFFQDARKFKARYATLGFSDKARLDDGKMWATGFALVELTAAEESRIVALLRRA